jgi:CheY-specific phosphatase CheX
MSEQMPGIGPLALDEHVAQALRRAINATLKETFQIDTRPESWSAGKGVPLILDNHVVCQINISQGSVPYGALIIAFDREILLKVLQCCGAGNDPAMIEDAAEELTNMIYGMFKTSMNMGGYHLMMDIPFIPRKRSEVVDKYGKAEKMVLPFLADGHRCQVVVAQSP